MKNEDELWRSVPGSDMHEVSSLGRVRNKLSPDKVLKPGTHTKGYLGVTVKLNGKRVTKTIHRLVAMAFLNPNGKFQVNHKDGNKKNNKLTNLELCDSSYNQLHRVYLLRKDNPGKYAELHDEIVKLYAGGMRLVDIGRKFGIGTSSATYIAKHSIASGKMNPVTGSAREKFNTLGIDSLESFNKRRGEG